MNKKAKLKKTATVVLVEDDNDLRAHLKKVLVDDGYNPACFDGTKSAVNYFQTRPWAWSPWLVITDLVMDGGGYQLIRRVQELYPDKNVYFLVISQLNTPDDKMEAELAGADLFLKKPFTDEEFLEAIKTATSDKPTHVTMTS